VERCPSTGHLLAAVVIRFAVDCAIEFEHRVDANFPDSLRDCSLLLRDSDLALVFVAAQFTLDPHLPIFGARPGEISRLSKGAASMPLSTGFPRSSVVLPRRRSGEREYRDIRCVANLLLGIAAEETDESDSVEVHTFLLFCPNCLGHPEASGRGSQDQE